MNHPWPLESQFVGPGTPMRSRWKLHRLVLEEFLHAVDAVLASATGLFVAVEGRERVPTTAVHVDLTCAVGAPVGARPHGA
jgi:hypothetical protein